MRECRVWFGRNWHCQSKVRRKYRYMYAGDKSLSTWFDVPDPGFATWISVKYSIQVYDNAKFCNGK